MDTLPQGLASLPNELILHIFEFIQKITDKRQFLKTCNKYNLITKQLIKQYEDNFIIKGFDKNNCYCIKKYVLELCHNSYFDLIPESLIYPDNIFLVQALAFFGDTVILDRLVKITISYYQLEFGYDTRHLADSISSLEYVICDYAILNDQLDVLVWIKNNYSLPKYVCSAAIENGKLEILKWLRKNGCKFSNFSSRIAARNGHVSCLQYTHVNGCEWNSTICSNAARGGHLSCLKYARENGCEWDNNVCYFAKKYGHTELLSWAIENGCPT